MAEECQGGMHRKPNVPQQQQQQHQRQRQPQPQQTQSSALPTSNATAIIPSIVQQLTTSKSSRKDANAHVRIVEQPASRAIRFRYECERRSAGSILGVNSTAVRKTYPTIEVVGYSGRGVVVVSCVTKDPPYRPHPYILTGKEGCRKGVCTVEIGGEAMRYVFNNLGIQCVRKKDIDEALRMREEIRVDPFKTGFAHRSKMANGCSSVDLNALRLCFQVFIEDDYGRFTIPLPPVVSDPILNKNSNSELTITEMCSSGTVLGNTQIMLLCEKVSKDDICVRFYEEKMEATAAGDQAVTAAGAAEETERNQGVIGGASWEAYGNFLPSDVHKQTSIRLKTPRYHNIYITHEVKVFVQLKRPSDGVVSDPWQFTYKPLDTSLALLRRKYCNASGGDGTQQRQLNAPVATTNMEKTPTKTAITATTNEFSIADLMVSEMQMMLRNSGATMTPSPQPSSPPTSFNPSCYNTNTIQLQNKLNSTSTPPKSPHEAEFSEFSLANVKREEATATATTPSTYLTEPGKPWDKHHLNEYGFVHEVGDEADRVYAHQVNSQHNRHNRQPKKQPQQQQDFGGCNLYYNAATTWDEGYANILRDVNNGSFAAAANNFYNCNMTNTALGCAAVGSQQNNAQTPGGQWNFPPMTELAAQSNVQPWQRQYWPSLNDFQQQQQTQRQQQHHHLQAQQQQQHRRHELEQQQQLLRQQQAQQMPLQANLCPTNIHTLENLGRDEATKDYHQQKYKRHDSLHHSYEAAAAAANRRKTAATTTTISNLLNLDSDELAKATGGDDEEMLVFNGEELQLSNLYIST